MKAARRLRLTAAMAAALVLGGCASNEGYDYTNFRQHPPRSILILPPLNASTTITATSGFLSTVSKPLAERGYYVFPVAVVDRMLKENGMPTAGEMHQMPLQKVLEITGADAVLYPEVLQYGSTYYVIASETTVKVRARLVDTRTGLTLWENAASVAQGSDAGNSIVANLIAAAITQVVSSSTDRAHSAARKANEQLFLSKNRQLPPGPYDPQFGLIPGSPNH